MISYDIIYKNYDIIFDMISYKKTMISYTISYMTMISYMISGSRLSVPIYANSMNWKKLWYHIWYYLWYHILYIEIMTTFMISLQKYDIIHNTIIYISNMAYIYKYVWYHIWYHHVAKYHIWYHESCLISYMISYMILYMMLSIYHEIVYDVICLAFLARPQHYDIIHDIIIVGMISYMISRNGMISYAF